MAQPVGRLRLFLDRLFVCQRQDLRLNGWVQSRLRQDRAENPFGIRPRPVPKHRAISDPCIAEP